MNKVIIIAMVFITVSTLTTLFIFLPSNVKHSQTVIKFQPSTPSGTSLVEHKAFLENCGGGAGSGHTYTFPTPYTLFFKGENPVGESPSSYLICGGHGGGSHDSVAIPIYFSR